MQCTEAVTAVVLAGGMARRMGGDDKGWVELDGKALIEHLLAVIVPQVSSCLINANRNRVRYAALGWPVIGDLEAGYQGPLMGILSGLQAATTDWVLVVPCDSPRLPADLLPRLLREVRHGGAEIAVAHDGIRLQPVVALLRRSLAPSLAQALADGERKIDRWYAQHKMVAVDFSDQPGAFVNINRPGDLMQLASSALTEVSDD